MFHRFTSSPAALGIGGALAGVLLLGGIAFAGAAGVGPIGTTATAREDAAFGGEPVVDATLADRKGNRLEAILDKLVQNGTITADQKTKILQAIADEAKSRGPRGPRGPKPEGFLGSLREEAAKAIGISVNDLKRELPGESLAQVAQTHGVSRADLVAKLTAAATSKLDKAVADKKLTADQAAKLKANLSDMVGRLVDQTRRGP